MNRATRPRKNFRDYPDLYFSIVERFQTDPSPFHLEGKLGDMKAARHDLYRFRSSLSQAIDTDGDAYAKLLFDTFKNLYISIHPPTGDTAEPATLTIRMNPLVRSMMEANVQRPQ